MSKGIGKISGDSKHVIAHEKTGKNGKRLVVFASTKVDIVDEAELEQLKSAKDTQYRISLRGREIPLMQEYLLHVPFEALPSIRLYAGRSCSSSSRLSACWWPCCCPRCNPRRESARRMQCFNHLKQMSLAVQNFENTFKVFPSHGTGGNPNYINGIPAGATGDPPQAAGVLFQILPYLEQQASLQQHRLQLCAVATGQVLFLPHAPQADDAAQHRYRHAIKCAQ